MKMRGMRIDGGEGGICKLLKTSTDQMTAKDNAEARKTRRFAGTVPVHPSTIEIWSSCLPDYFGGEVMADIERISAQQTHAKAESNKALLVCAYDDEAKCRMVNLEGSISFASFKSRVNSLPKSQEIIFY